MDTVEMTVATFRLSVAQMEAMRKAAAEQERSLAFILRKAVDDWLERNANASAEERVR